MKEDFKQYTVNEKRTDYIPLAECKKGFVYKIHSRNLGYGVYDGQGGFIGIREKLGSRYLFAEFHYDTGAPYGTVKPLELICELPSDIPCTERDKNEFGDDWGNNPETGQIEPVIRRDLKDGEPQHGRRQGFVDEWASNGKRLPDNLYPFLSGNKRLFEFLDKYEKK